MNGFFIGQIIKQKREELGLSQEQLCEGICTPATLSRIENGKQAPAYNRMNALLQRLDLPENRYYALMTKQELEIERLQKEIIVCNTNYERLQGEQKIEAYHRGQVLLVELESIMDKEDDITRQFILRSKAVLCREDNGDVIKKQRALLLDAIHLTAPNFDEENINQRLYNLTEVKIIIQLAANYSDNGQHKKAIDLLSQLLKYVQKHFKRNTQAVQQLSHITYSYALALGIDGRYEDSIEIAELGRQLAIDYGYYHFLPGLAHIMAECNYRLGNEEKSKNFYYQAYYVYKLLGNEHDRISIEKEARRFLNLEFF